MSKTNAVRAVAQFQKRFDQMHSTGLKAAELVQEIGVQVLEHYKAHQDVTLINAYFLALPPGANYKAMTMWLLAYGSLRVNTGPDKATVPFKFAKDKGTDPEQAAQNPWFKMAAADKPTADAKAFDIQAAMLALLKRAAKAETLNGDFNKLRAAARAVGIPESDIPASTDKALKAQEQAAGQKMARSTKENKAPGTGLDVSALAEAAPALV